MQLQRSCLTHDLTGKCGTTQREHTCTYEEAPLEWRGSSALQNPCLVNCVSTPHTDIGRFFSLGISWIWQNPAFAGVLNHVRASKKPRLHATPYGPGVT